MILDLTILLQVLVNYARSSKEAEEVSKEVCTLVFRVLCTYMSIPIEIDFLSPLLIAHEFQPPGMSVFVFGGILLLQ